ncbi:hypothetical protein LJR098_003748 [Rhizobium sp. LjRoot98]|uniref:hypothetical protein n=1 Tax=unclassified Rhizobium TaxID=2613769 RepID=UPI0012E36FE8|nr:MULTISPECIES: hypothetical protein [unclassified Rhizobium]
MSDVGAFLTQLPFKENAVLERIVREMSVPAGTNGLAQLWDSPSAGYLSGLADGTTNAQTHLLHNRHPAAHAGLASV